MNASDLKKITNKIEDRDFLEAVYNKFIVPLLTEVANKKDNTLYINGHNNKYVRGSYGNDFENNSIWGLCKMKMKPLLIEKGFKVQDVSSVTGVAIYW